METSASPEILKRSSSLEKRKVGSLRLVLSMMYGGKTTYLIHIVETLGYACRVLYVNHTFDTRGDEPYSTHSAALDKSLSSKLNATMIKVKKLGDIPTDYLYNHSVVCIDESQFFEDLYERVNYMVDDLGLDVFVVGLNGDYKRRKFGRIAELLPDVDDIKMLRETLCSECASRGERIPALFTWKINDESGCQIEVGADNYTPVCRGCYNKMNAQRNCKG
jgi:thymidine kinase